MDDKEPLLDAIDCLQAHETGDEVTAVFDSQTAESAQLDLALPLKISSVCSYRLESLLGQGGMGMVYRAFSEELDRHVAVKVLHERYKRDVGAIRRFQHESRIKSSLQHPGVAPVYGTGVFPDGRPFYAMKLLEGKTLAKMIASDDGDSNDLLSVAAQVCQTMAYAHSRGIIHVDLKPSNIMVGDFGRVLVIDWGLARTVGTKSCTGVGLETAQLDWSSTYTIVDQPTGSVCGTLAYMSPEQARGGMVDERTDVFSLGAILCEILTGSPVYKANSARQLLRRAFRASTAQAFLRLEQSECELWLISLVKRCLSVDPEFRPANAGELANELAHFQASALELVESDMIRFFELSPDLFCIAGFDGCFRRVNSNFPRLTGRTQRELLSQPFLNFVHPDDRERTIAIMGQTLEGLPVKRFRNRYVKGDGTLLTLEWTAKSVKAEGLIYAVARDVSGD